MTFISSCCYVYLNSYAQSNLHYLPPLLTGTTMKPQTTESYYELDNEPTKEQILRGECERIHVTGWDEAEEYLETQKDFHFLSYEEWEPYWNNRFYCTTTEDTLLPL